MSDIRKNGNNKYVDGNLDRLLDLGESIPVMPEALKNRIRSKLIQMVPESKKKNPFSFRWALMPIAVGAALIFFLLFPWKGDLNGNISWADVRRHLDNIQTVMAKVDIVTSMNGENRTVISGRVYRKDPGFMRSEIYNSDNDLDDLFPQPQRIVINKRAPGRSEWLTWEPGSNKAEWTTEIYRTTGPENPPTLIVDAASESWQIMKKLTEDNTQFIGEEVIDGIPAVGFSFEGPVQEIIPSANATGRAHGKIFVRREDGGPIYIEAEHQTAFGENTQLKVSDIQWNIPLEDKLFYFSVQDYWEVNRIWTETAEYTDTKPAPGICLDIGIDQKEPLVKVEDVEGIVRVEQISYPKSDSPGHMNVTIQLKEEAFQRLNRQAKINPQKIIVVNFNGQSKSVTRLDTGFPGRLIFDLSRLNISLSDLEKRYFTKTTTVYEGDEK